MDIQLGHVDGAPAFDRVWCVFEELLLRINRFPFSSILSSAMCESYIQRTWLSNKYVLRQFNGGLPVPLWPSDAHTLVTVPDYFSYNSPFPVRAHKSA